MIDYLYQLDYDDLLPSRSYIVLGDDIAAESESPVAKSVACFANLGRSGLASEEIHSSFPDIITEPEPVRTNITSPNTESEVVGQRLPWDHCLTSSERRRTEKRMRLNGTWDHRLTQERIDEEAAAVAESKAVSDRETTHLQDDERDLDTARLTVNALMYALADKYEIEDLKLLALSKFATAADQDWESLAFVYAAELVFRTTPGSDQGLRNIVIKTLNKRRKLIRYEEV